MFKSIYALILLIFKPSEDTSVCPECHREYLETIDSIEKDDCSLCADYLSSRISGKPTKRQKK